MLTFEIITIFPDIFQSYFQESILKRALQNQKITIKIHNLRDYTTNKHRKVDDNPYGGGAGMILQLEPIYNALVAIMGKENLVYKNKSNTKKDTKVILFSAKGERYKQTKAQEFTQLQRIIFICGRYEGVDERVSQFLVDEEVSVGDFILTGGEIPAMLVIDSVTRLLDGVLGNNQSILEESHSKHNLLEYPQYTKPDIFSPDKNTQWEVPEILLSGHHQNIEKWRQDNTKLSIDEK